MCLRAHDIDNNNVGVGRLRRCGLSNNNGAVGGGRVIYDTSKVSNIQIQKWRLQHREDGPEELATMTEASAEELELEVSTKTMD